MSFLIPVMIWGWIPFTIVLFRTLTPQKAVLISVIGGVLFLPVTSYDLPMIKYDKETAIGAALLIGIIFSGKLKEYSFKLKRIDIPIISWCIIVPLISLMANGLGLYNSIAAIIETSLVWGVYYTAGRLFFSDEDHLRQLSKGIIIGGLIYVPLTLFEVRMSPQMSIIVYGFFPHSFLQHIRYGGYRPIVFMTHGLMVSLWMAATYTVSLWLYRTKKIVSISNIPMVLIVLILLITTILCKSANGIIYLLLGTLGYFFYKKLKSNIIFKLIILFIPMYLFFRISGVLHVETIIFYLSKIFDAQRIESLSVRLYQEELFGRRALLSPLWGWGWIGRVWPINIETGANAVRMIDALYLAIFSVRGFLGLLSLYAVLLLGPWKIIKSRAQSIDAVALSLIVIFFAIDTLVNGMINPVYTLTAGAILSFSEKIKFEKLTKSNEIQY